jgi:hypothetical protein
MRRRAFINIVAAFSLLVHAGFVARHNFLTLAQKVEAQWLLPDGTVICHSGGENEPSKSRDPLSNQPSNPQKTSCPLCLGLGPALAVLSNASGDVAPPAFIFARFKPVPTAAAVLGHAVSVPPSRGPPSFA